MRFSRRLIITGMLSLLAAGCSSLGLESDATYSDKDKEQLYKNGSLASDQGGFNLFGGSSKKSSEGKGLGVNAFLWRATLDTLSFLPLDSADPFGGVVLTDWYTVPNNPNERTKVNAYIRDRDLRADGIKVVVFRQIRGTSGVWVDVPASSGTASALENAILTRARQIKIAQKQFQ